MTAGVEDEHVDGPVVPVPEVAGGGRRGAERGPTVDREAGADPSVITGPEAGTVRGAAGRPRTPITVGEAYRAKLRAAAAAPPEPDAAGAPDPVGTAPAAASSGETGTPPPPPSHPGPRQGPPGPGGPDVVRRPPPHLRARPRIEPEQGILGLSRHTRSRLGSRLFNLFFVCVFALILVQMVVALLAP